jgi:flagellar FliL protein
MKSLFGAILLLLTLFSFPIFATAEEHGGEGGAGGNPYEKLDPFTVNLVGQLHQTIQIAITLKPATLTIGEKIKLYMPVIRHEIIMLLSGKTPEQVQTSEGKQKLIVETRYAANKALGLTSKDGIADVLFESLIIQ